MNKDFSFYLSNFLGKYLKVERNMSLHTIRSYRKTFQLLIDYLVNTKEFKLKDITFNKVTREIIIDFLNYLENDKKNSIKTRNQRLASIKSFYQYCAIDEIDNIDNIRKILSIKSKKEIKKIMAYLTEEELKTLFDGIDTTAKIGRRDLTVLTLLYDTAARASEIIDLKLDDIHLEEKYIILTGKGNKQRIVSIMEQTKKLLISYIKENNVMNGYLFQKSNNSNCKMNSNFIMDIVLKYNKILNKKISPHIFRHTRAVHLLDKGVNPVYIQELLGHSSINTTMEYAKVIEKSKFDAIEKASPQINNDLPDWNDDIDLLSQLLNL